MTGNIAQFPDLGKDITSTVLRCAIKVHKELGPGLLESVYGECLFYELQKAGLNVEKQKNLPIVYHELKIDNAFKIDLWVENRVAVELKAVEKILPVHEAQLLTYMKLSKSPLGLLINFNETLLKNGVRRLALSGKHNE